MAITFPLSGLFDRYGIKTNSFLVDFRQSTSRDGAGNLTVIDYRLPKWKASFSSAVMSEDDCLEIEAELLSLNGAARVFLATDTRRPFPRKGAQSAVYGSAQITAVSLVNNTVTLSGLPANLDLSRGDKFSVAVNGIHYLYALAEPISANSSGVTGAVTVTPTLNPAVTAPRSAVFAKPPCSMRLIYGSIAFNPSGALLGTVSFDAEQI